MERGARGGGGGGAQETSRGGGWGGQPRADAAGLIAHETLAETAGAGERTLDVQRRAAGQPRQPAAAEESGEHHDEREQHARDDGDGMCANVQQEVVKMLAEGAGA